MKGRNAMGREIKRWTVFLLVLILVLSLGLLTGCGQNQSADGESEGSEEVSAPGDIVVLFTSDIHCGVEQGWGLAGLQAIRESLEAKGDNVLLVDDGDAIQGEPIGMFTHGREVIELMDKAGYDVAIPGNHEFDYGVDNLLDMAGDVSYPYICCNLFKDGELVFEPYIIKEAGGKKIAFIGVTTPETITSSNPKSFQDENGDFIYDFLQSDQTGQEFFNEVQKNVDQVRAEGADIVILMAHLGMDTVLYPWDYATVAENTYGIDAILDGHSHDYEKVSVKNSEGKIVLRQACGTKMRSIGWLRISSEDGSMDTGLFDWNNDISATELLGIKNEMSASVKESLDEVNKELEEVIAHTSFDLTIYDPEAVTDGGQPIRIVRRAETNMGDLIADAFRIQTEADIAIIGGGAIRVSIPAGDITKGDILKVMPFSNDLVVSEVTGQQILDALEWGAHALPEEFGSFLQVSGISYEVDPTIPDPCEKDKNGMFAGVTGERRVRNVMVGDDPLDPEKKYTLASSNFTIKNKGDGMAMFSEDDVIREVMVDNEAVINYIVDTLEGNISEEYADPYGAGRITAWEAQPQQEG